MKFALALVFMIAVLSVTWAKKNSELDQVDPMCIVAEIMEMSGCVAKGFSINAIVCLVKALVKLIGCFTKTALGIDLDMSAGLDELIASLPMAAENNRL